MRKIFEHKMMLKSKQKDTADDSKLSGYALPGHPTCDSQNPGKAALHHSPFLVTY